MANKTKSILSASRIKTLDSCSWKYWGTYHLGLPRSKNPGSSRGTVCHTVLEVLLNPRHRKHIKKITKHDTIKAVPSVYRLTEKNLKKEGYLSDENLQMCDEMILVALNCDFLGGRGAKITEPEKEFLLDNSSPSYKVLGYMDKPEVYKNGKKLVIVDYKTSKSKFTKSEIDYNIQALVYLLAAKEIWPEVKECSIKFQFLRFPEDPDIIVTAQDEELQGFEYFLEHVFKLINNYDEHKAKSNFAAHQPFPKKEEGFKGPLNCGFAKYPGQLKKDGTPMWHCEHKFAFDYYACIDEKGKQIASSKNKDDVINLNGKIVKKHYAGCPAHPQESTESKPEKPEFKDDFDF